MAGQTQNPPIHKPFALYPRVSRQGPREDEKFRSPEFQLDTMTRYAEASGLAYEAYPAEIDVSGSTPTRAILETIVAGIEDGELAGLIVARLDRLSRLRPRDRIMLFERIEDAGGLVLSASENLDPSTPEGRFARDVFLGVARMQWERYAEGFKMAKASAVERGVYVSKRAPIGYSFTEEHRLEPNEDAGAVRGLFLLAASGASRSELVDYLAERTGRRMDPRSIRGVLANRAYLGHSVHGQLENLDAHRAIVTPEEWKAAQPSPNQPRRAPGNRSLLAGIARCASCGRKMASTAAGGASKGTRVYRCPRNSGSGPKCPAPATINEERLDVYVIEAVRGWARGEGLEDAVIEARPMDEAHAEARAALALAEERRDAYAVETAAMDIPAKTIALGLQAREEAVKRAAERLEELEDADANAVVRTTLRELWPTLATADRRTLIASVIERVAVTPRSFHGESVESRSTLVWRPRT